MNTQMRNWWITVLVAASVAAIIVLVTPQTARADGPTFTADVTDTLRGIHYSSVACPRYRWVAWSPIPSLSRTLAAALPRMW